MSNYKQDITLNEKDSLQDLLVLEKEMVKIYATAITEGCSAGFRSVAEDNFKCATDSQFDVFLQMTEHDYYRVHTAPEEEIEKNREKFSQVKNQLKD